ncbi:MAG: hypothetical protein K2K04_04405, partial [Clostridia bacterium]|nr:hypothetical protein [Clostridia bacterium]
QYAAITRPPFEPADDDQGAEITSTILAADFGALLPVLETGEGTLKIAVNADEVLALFGVDLGRVQLGNVTLAYDHGADSKLVAMIPAFGLSADICGAAGGLKQMPAPESCLDLTKLLNTVQAVWEQVDGITDSQSVAFEMVEGENFLSLDGIVVEIWGKGEVSWKAGEEYVALDLSMSITERATDVLTLKFIYDKNAVNEPLVKLALNNVGIEIYNDDIQSVKDGFNAIYNKVTALLNKDGEKTQPTEPDNGGAGGNKIAVTDKLLGVLFGILADDGWVDGLNNLTLTTDGKSVALSYLSDNAVDVEISADGGLSLFYDGAFGDRFSLSGGIAACAAADGLRGAIDAKLANCRMSSSKTDGSARFIKLAYDYLFAAVSAIDVGNILGSDTYTVTFK